MILNTKTILTYSKCFKENTLWFISYNYVKIYLVENYVIMAVLPLSTVKQNMVNGQVALKAHIV